MENRTGEGLRAPGIAAVLALVGEVATSGLCGLDVSVVPCRRLDELARYGMAARVGQLKKHPPARRYATLVATVTRLRAKTTDDALDLLICWWSPSWSARPTSR